MKNYAEAIEHYKNAEEVFKVIHLPDSAILVTIREDIKKCQELLEN